MVGYKVWIHIPKIGWYPHLRIYTAAEKATSTALDELKEHTLERLDAILIVPNGDGPDAITPYNFPRQKPEREYLGE